VRLPRPSSISSLHAAFSDGLIVYFGHCVARARTLRLSIIRRAPESLMTFNHFGNLCAVSRRIPRETS
jgi:hypothetical protein